MYIQVEMDERMLSNHEVLRVSQQVEPLQAVTGIETENRYRIVDHNGDPILFAYEESGFMSRQLLGGHRPITMNVIGREGQLLMVARRKHFWFLSHLELLYPDGTLLGKMEQRFHLFGRRFNLIGVQGESAMVQGPMFRPHTFWVRRNGGDLAKITKEWGGLAQELVTVADHFTIEFHGPQVEEHLRWAIIGAAFAIDLEYFENRGGRGGLRPGVLGGHSYDAGGFTGKGF
ncbi:MAG: hypothetical protein BZY75_01765 [SAR202 cluster bacterium Io17-Chloro-G7]|nr:MAG: hypothetical protein BZY75_01765 [SAR202 cluster bacterium Io17-Chloro-G7]